MLSDDPSYPLHTLVKLCNLPLFRQGFFVFIETNCEINFTFLNKRAILNNGCRKKGCEFSLDFLPQVSYDLECREKERFLDTTRFNTRRAGFFVFIALQGVRKRRNSEFVTICAYNYFYRIGDYHCCILYIYNF